MGKNLPDPMDELRCDGRSPVGDSLQAREVVFIEFQELGQQIDHRRDQDGVGDTLSFDRLAEFLRAESWNRDLAGTERGRREQKRKIHNVKHRRPVEISTAFLVEYPLVEEED